MCDFNFNLLTTHVLKYPWLEHCTLTAEDDCDVEQRGASCRVTVPVLFVSELEFYYIVFQSPTRRPLRSTPLLRKAEHSTAPSVSRLIVFIDTSAFIACFAFKFHEV